MKIWVYFLKQSSETLMVFEGMVVEGREAVRIYAKVDSGYNK